jgi:PBP1b-binding outer membrane lipoprotein LpoB
MRAFSTLTKRVISFSTLIVILFLVGCGSYPAASASEITTSQLTSSGWKISSVQVDATDQTALFTNMTLSFTATNYTTTKGGVVWPASGTWSFVDNTAKKIKRNDNLEVTITEITDTTLKLSLTWATGTFGSGRTSSVAGNHIFSFVK